MLMIFEQQGPWVLFQDLFDSSDQMGNTWLHDRNLQSKKEPKDNQVLYLSSTAIEKNQTKTNKTKV